MPEPRVIAWKNNPFKPVLICLFYSDLLLFLPFN